MKRSPGRWPIEPRTWLHSLSRRAATWGRPRRVVLAVEVRKGEPLLSRFFLVTSLDDAQMSRREALGRDPKRGNAKGHVGELEDLLASVLSWTNRRSRAGAGANRGAVRRLSMLSRAMRYAC